MGLKEKALKKASPLYDFTNHLIELIMLSLDTDHEDGKLMVATFYMKIKFSTKIGVRCKERTKKPKVTKAMETLQLFSRSTDKVVRILSILTSENRENLIHCLRANADIFVWSTVDIPGVNPQVEYFVRSQTREAKEETVCTASCGGYKLGGHKAVGHRVHQGS
ncbi:hypothetical protein EPI10_020601 [Gossypium australe]|uniref:Uncharacterized protein n=1 Tax=Gossypium australe TaxID=47621 RepID=A0A5B6WFN8_9ROSI|nr:hypothetical protein EPI10_020601 [Gossypium australe]